MTAQRVILIGASAYQERAPAAAKDLYTGALFRVARAYAEKEAERGGCLWAILSPKHALLLPTTLASPYVQRVSRSPASRRAWGVWTAECLSMWLYGPLSPVPSVQTLRIEILANRDLADPLEDALASDRTVEEVLVPLRQLPAQGRLRWLRERTARSNLQLWTASGQAH